jgi:predicted small metal-binding protein
MGRQAMDCRLIPSEVPCTLLISADDEDELLDASVVHAVSVHQHEDTPELREMLRGALVESTA